MGSLLKICFCSVTILSAIAVIGLAGGGVWYSLQLKQMTDLRNYETYQLDFRIRWAQILPYIFSAVGTFGLLIIFCGLCGIGSRGCLLMYAICSSIFLLTVVGVGAMAILLAVDNSEAFIRETLNSAVNEASQRPEIRARFEEFEKSLHCCGVDGPNDYKVRADLFEKFNSFCKGEKSVLIVHGCFDVASHYTKLAYYSGTALCAFIAVLTFAGIIFSIALVRKKSGKVIE